MFQSSPVLWDGRYIIFLAHITPPVCFNPRPSCGTGATKLADPATVEVYRFQSSPVLWDGRYQQGQGYRVLQPVFQSSPVLWDGRYRSRQKPQRLRRKFQSSPVLWDGRYVRWYDHRRPPVHMFQSSPVLWDGRYQF